MCDREASIMRRPWPARGYYFGGEKLPEFSKGNFDRFHPELWFP
jgi:hypothetical protein